jgi:hypothetical protein
MKGKITHINQVRGMGAVKTETEGYSIFELLSKVDIAIGDEIEWENDTNAGTTKVRNNTKNISFNIFFQNHRVGEEILLGQLRLLK